MQERLQKIISQAGIASRRAAEQLIAAGRVTVDGRAAVLGEKADPAAQRIAVDGKPLPRAERHVYYLLHKPTGYISTARDERGRRTVLYLLPEVRARIYPVGRLDGDTSGLLLITNDGTLMNGLLHPRYEVSKTYVAQVAGQVTEQSLEQLRRGLQLEDGMTAPAKARLLGSRGGLSKVEVTIHEGRNRQVRRMFSAIGCDVRKLKRVRFAFLSLKDVAVGQHRPLTPKEVDRLYQLAGIVRQGDKE